MAKSSKAKAPARGKKTEPAAAKKPASGKNGAAIAKNSASAAKPAGKTGKSIPPGKRAAGAPRAAKKPARKVPRLEHVDEKTLRQIIAKLEELRDESRHVVNAHVQADLQHREESGEVGDDMDQASSERDREFSLIIHQRHLRRLKQIDEAFERIYDESYGLCEGTDEPINPKRLLIMPLARYSLEYQQQQEKMLGRSPEDAFSQIEEGLISDE